MIDRATRLIKAARRTIRAEATLILVILIITSWSVYALYRLTISGSDSLLGFNLHKSPPRTPALPASSTAELQQQASLKARLEQQVNEGSNEGGNLYGNQPSLAGRAQTLQASTIIPSSPETRSAQLAYYKAQIMRELMARQRELYKRQEPPSIVAGQPSLLERGTIATTTTTSTPHRVNNHNDLPLTERWPATNLAKQSNMDNMLTELRNNNNNIQQRQVAAPFVEPLSSLVAVDEGHQQDVNDGGGGGNETGDREAEESAVSPNELNDSFARQQMIGETTTQANGSEAAAEPSTTTEMVPPLESTTESPSEQSVDSATNQPDEEEEAGDESETEPEGGSGGPPTESANASDVGEQESGQGGEQPDKLDEESMRRVKKTVNAIDEEVDRMTQPSLGTVSQQEVPFDYKNAVQFDDTTAVVAPNSSSSRGSRFIIERPLLAERTSPQTSAIDAKKGEAQQARTKTVPQVTVAASKPKDLDVDHNRKSISTDIVSATVEPLTGTTRTRATRTNETVTNGGQTKPENPLKRLRRSPVRGRNATQRFAPRRRNDGDEVDGSEENQEDDNQEEEEVGATAGQLVAPAMGAMPQNYQYITSNEPSLQDLLNHKNLLEALQSSRPPPGPIASGSTTGGNNATLLRAASNFTSDPNRDHQLAADSLYTVDHGLLLYPSSEEEITHKSKSNKGSKAEKKKKKEKMTVAMKKGGHKKKKHKKEEKKYFKEKKFKGAKKGKKMKKGKGRKGGKKGFKFYKDKGFKKKGFKNIYVKNEFGQKKSYFDEFRDKNYKKKWKNFDDKYNYAQMKKWQAKDMKGAKKMKDHGEKFKKYDKAKWKKKYNSSQQSQSSKKKKKYDEFK